ncbi:MAG: hypothetical protein JXB13_16975 [Phycisphaerae bacterium]|nr:hypothetical protein [Phycisphaerae bacterium]
MARQQDFDSSVRLPPGLEIVAVRKSIDYIERELTDLVELYFEQKNVFSGIVGIFGTRALAQHSPYEKVRHTDMAQTRFPDLRHRGKGNKASPQYCLESKASIRPWAIQSHYDHEGWYILWRYLVDPTMQIEEKKPVVVWRTDVVYLRQQDWKYEGSSAGSSGGGRTHTFGVQSPSTRLRGCALYRRSDIRLLGGKPVQINGGH